MKILYIIEESKLGGPQVQMVRVASALACKAEIEILMSEENSEQFRKLCDDHKIRYRTFPISRLTKELKPLAIFFLRSPIEIIRLARYVQQTKPELIHSWGGSWQFKAAIVSRITGVPLVWLINDTKVPNAILLIFRQFARLCRGFVFASHRSADYYSPFVPKKTASIVIQSMVDIKTFDLAQDRPGDQDFIARLGGAVVVGMIANISPIKGIDTFIRVAARAQSSGLDIRFVVIGSVFTSQQTYFESLKMLCEDLGVANVIFAGGRADVRPLLKRFDIYLCTSIAESSPVAVWEAMAMSLPIVSTDVGDVPRFVRNGENGYITPVGDDLALWQATELLCLDRALMQLMGAAARKRAETNFSQQVIADQTLNFYKPLIYHR